MIFVVTDSGEPRSTSRHPENVALFDNEYKSEKVFKMFITKVDLVCGFRSWDGWSDLRSGRR